MHLSLIVIFLSLISLMYQPILPFSNCAVPCHHGLYSLSEEPWFECLSCSAASFVYSICDICRYLEDMDGSCTMTIEESLCESPSSRLNIANYLQRRTDAANTYSPLQPVIDIENGLDKIATVLTVFQCSSDLTTDTSSLSICSWDDGQTYPPSPTLTAGVCRNAVIDVNYDIEYNNTSITKITATYILADVVLETVNTETYTREWYVDVPINATTNSSSGINTTSVQIERQYMNDTVTVSSSFRTVLSTRYKVQFSQAGVGNTVTYSGKPGLLIQISDSLDEHD